MAYTTLVDPETVIEHLDDSTWVLVDCRFSLADTGSGRRAYAERTVQGAVYADLDRNLSGRVVPGKTGRHPLPGVETLLDTLRRFGIDDGSQVVAFDDAGGPYAARLWWLLRLLGHDDVAVMDGGLDAYVAAGGPTAPGENRERLGTMAADIQPERLASARDVLDAMEDVDATLVDARSGARYRGEEEPIDFRKGHIVGAKNAFWKENLDERGRFLPPDALRSRFEAVLDGRPAQQAICYCGSGVTACHDLLAMVHAGLDGARLYAGSWSEWITDPSRPTEPER